MLAIITLIAAIIVVIATSVLKNVEMSKNQKNLIATVVSIVAGSVAAVVESGGVDNITAGGIMGAVLIVYGSAQLVYKFLLPDSVEDFLSQGVGNTVK